MRETKAIVSGLALLAAIAAGAASTGLKTNQAVTAAPGGLDVTTSTSREGTSLAFAKADHGHSSLITGTGTGVTRTLQDWFGSLYTSTSTLGAYLLKSGGTMTGGITGTTSTWQGNAAGPALSATGYGANSGISVTGGASGGSGLYASGGADSGPGVYSTGGWPNGSGVFGAAQGSGYGIWGYGGTTTGVGGRFTGGATNGYGITAQGGGDFPGIYAKSGGVQPSAWFEGNTGGAIFGYTSANAAVATFGQSVSHPANGIINLTRAVGEFCPTSPGLGDVWWCGTGLGIQLPTGPVYVQTVSSSAYLTLSPAGAWVDAATGGLSNYNPLSYSRDIAGQVHLHGLVKSGSCGTPITYALPEGYRPAKQFAAGTVDFNLAPALLTVQPDGVLVMYCTGVTSTYAIPLDGISFDTPAQ